MELSWVTFQILKKYVIAKLNAGDNQELTNSNDESNQ